MRAPSLPGLLVSHWHVAWQVDAEALIVVGLYLGAAAGLRGRWPARRTASFLAGMALLLLALQSGLDTYDDQMLSAHMTQHMLLLLLAPLLLLGGQPAILVLRTLPGPDRRELARVLRRLGLLLRPLVCLGVFSTIVLVAHLPVFYDATLRSGALHDLEHALFVVAGLLLWWPVLDGNPVAGHRLGGVARLAYVIAAMVPMSAVGAYLNRAPTVVYAGYAEAARTLGISALGDQAQAGAIMWVGSGVVMMAVGLWSVMSALAAEERRQRALDVRAARLERLALSELELEVDLRRGVSP